MAVGLRANDAAAVSPGCLLNPTYLADASNMRLASLVPVLGLPRDLLPQVSLVLVFFGARSSLHLPLFLRR